MEPRQARDLISIICKVVENHADLRGLALCGSWARGNPRPASDLDMLILAADPVKWREDQDWIVQLPYEEARLTYRNHIIATYGAVWSAHIRLEPEAELELTFAFPEWACVAPVDPGTRKVVSDAFKILIDKDHRLTHLLAVCKSRLDPSRL